MPITLNHTIVPAYDKEKTARFYARIFGFEYIGAFASFVVVRVNETLCLDFAVREQFEPHHYAFKVSDDEFDQILARIKAESIAYGSSPYDPGNMGINYNYGGRGVYFRDENGHLLEILTADYEINITE
jgi:catechol 2,3-dioxygenase-like lactoylglutathione lyase family enzyme